MIEMHVFCRFKKKNKFDCYFLHMQKMFHSIDECITDINIINMFSMSETWHIYWKINAKRRKSKIYHVKENFTICKNE